MAPVEFAPEYTKGERVRFVALGALAGAAVISVCQLWFFPWLRDFSASAPCRSFFGVNGIVLLMYGMFVGVPLLAAVLVGALVSRRGYKILRQGRVPPRGEKVFRPTPVQTGAKARWSGYMQLLSVVPLLGLTVWGAFQAQSLVANAAGTPVKCVPNPSIERTPSSQLRWLPGAAHVER